MEILNILMKLKVRKDMNNPLVFLEKGSLLVNAWRNGRKGLATGSKAGILVY